MKKAKKKKKRKKKKVTFEEKEEEKPTKLYQEEDGTIDDLVGGSLKTAKTVSQPVQAFPREEPGPSNPPSIYTQPLLPGWGPYSADIRFRNDILPAICYEPEDHAIDEGVVRRAILRRTKGHGVHYDDPVTARAVIESLQGHQQVLDLYLGAQVPV